MDLEPKKGIENTVRNSERELGTRISDVCKLIGGRKDAAKIGGVSESQLQRYIAGKSQPAFAPVARICAAASVSMEWVWSGESSDEGVSNGPNWAHEFGHVAEPVAPYGRAQTSVADRFASWITGEWEHADERRRNWLEMQLQTHFPGWEAGEEPGYANVSRDGKKMLEVFERLPADARGDLLYTARILGAVRHDSGGVHVDMDAVEEAQVDAGMPLYEEEERDVDERLLRRAG